MASESNPDPFDLHIYRCQVKYNGMDTRGSDTATVVEVRPNSGIEDLKMQENSPERHFHQEGPDSVYWVLQNYTDYKRPLPTKLVFDKPPSLEATEKIEDKDTVIEITRSPLENPSLEEMMNKFLVRLRDPDWSPMKPIE